MRRYISTTLLALLILSCSQQEKKTVSLDNNPFNGGTQGLAFSFQELPKEVFDGANAPFDVTLKLENKGETLVQKDNAHVKLSGINPTEFSKTETDLIKSASDDVIELRKDPQGNIILGQQTSITFSNLNHKDKIIGAQAQFPLRADLCYLYRTSAVSKLCVRQNLLTPPTGGICEINADKQLYNSGAPVQFTNFKENTRAKDKIGFVFDIQNIGGGNTFERNTICSRSDRKTQDHIYVIVNTALSGLQCTGLDSTSKGAEGYITLYSGSKTISCTQQISTSSDFEQLVNLEAHYDYEQSIQDSILVKSSGSE